MIIQLSFGKHRAKAYYSPRTIHRPREMFVAFHFFRFFAGEVARVRGKTFRPEEKIGLNSHCKSAISRATAAVVELFTLLCPVVEVIR
jgi:hypothetical protein